jgi:hypothetical protein
LRLLGAIVAFTRNALALALIMVEALAVPVEGSVSAQNEKNVVYWSK